MNSIELMYTRGRDVKGWALAHERGEVPSRMPYGLDHLASEGYDVRTRAVPRIGRAGQALDRFGGRIEWTEEFITRHRRRADVLASWSESCGIPAALRAHRPPVASGVIWLTEPDYRMSVLTRKLVIKALDRADAVWALSRAQIPVLRRQFKVVERRIHYLPFGIDCDFWTFQSGQAPDPDLIVSVGNDRHRDHTTLVRAMPEIRRARPGAALILVSSKPVPGLTEPDRQIFSLTHHELRELYSRAGLAVMSTRHNLHVSGMTALLEAGAMGLPVVATRTPGIEDYLLHEQTGLLVTVGDSSDMASAVISMLTNQGSSGMGSRARSFISEQHSCRSQARALAEIITGVL